MPIGTFEILLIFLILLLLFGSKKLPELARSLGEAIKEFKKGLK
ncbi:MAG: twin-arginine translocase TatA/TatE family subunit [Candidatus Altiarchaeota archaeon]